MSQTENPWPEINRRNIDYWTKMGRLNLWSGILGHEKLENEVESHRKNREAEESHVRKTVWGYEDGSDREGEEMRQTVLGDLNNYQSPSPPPPQKQSSLPTIAALAATLAVGGVLGYVLNNDKPAAPKQEPPAFDDSSVSIGLGRIEDYMKNGADK